MAKQRNKRKDKTRNQHWEIHESNDGSFGMGFLVDDKKSNKDKSLLFDAYFFNFPLTHLSKYLTGSIDEFVQKIKAHNEKFIHLLGNGKYSPDELIGLEGGDETISPSINVGRPRILRGYIAASATDPNSLLPFLTGDNLFGLGLKAFRNERFMRIDENWLKRFTHKRKTVGCIWPETDRMTYRAIIFKVSNTGLTSCDSGEGWYNVPWQYRTEPQAFIDRVLNTLSVAGALDLIRYNLGALEMVRPRPALVFHLTTGETISLSTTELYEKLSSRFSDEVNTKFKEVFDRCAEMKSLNALHRRLSNETYRLVGKLIQDAKDGEENKATDASSQRYERRGYAERNSQHHQR